MRAGYQLRDAAGDVVGGAVKDEDVARRAAS